MQVHNNLVQGTPEWHKFRSTHFGASEASAMLGLSPYCKRTELLSAKSGLSEREFSDFVQRHILDKGHKVEALALPIIEEIIGQELYQVVCSKEQLSVSCDGLTIDDLIVWECKQWNNDDAELVRNGELPEKHWPQCQQALYVTGTEKLIFSITDGTVEGTVWMWVFPNPDQQAQIIVGWDQFQKDLVNFVPKDVKELPNAEMSITLPTLFVHAKGEITSSNMNSFGEALTQGLALARSIVLVEDQDFSNAKAAAKKFREAIQELKLAKDAMLSQTVTIGEAAKKIDAWCENLRLTALQLEKDCEKEDKAKKEKMILEAKTAYQETLNSLEASLAPIKLVLVAPDFLGAIKGKRNYASMQDAVDTTLANAQAQATYVANDIDAKLQSLKPDHASYGILFNDLQQIIYKPLDDFKLLVTSRIEAHKQAEAKKAEEQRAAIQAEEERKAQAKLDAERAKIEAEARKTVKRR